MTIDDSIVQYIKEMSEQEAKKLLASVLLKHNRIGRNNYTKESFLSDMDQISLEIVARDMFK
jgi:tRNA threonylcarbamoyladenosine modification (KEOPS) complex  Pcc1 subunit